jgi:hypothetical protein
MRLRFLIRTSGHQPQTKAQGGGSELGSSCSEGMNTQEVPGWPSERQSWPHVVIRHRTDNRANWITKPY